MTCCLYTELDKSSEFQDAYTVVMFDEIVMARKVMYEKYYDDFIIHGVKKICKFRLLSRFDRAVLSKVARIFMIDIHCVLSNVIKNTRGVRIEEELHLLQEPGSCVDEVVNVMEKSKAPVKEIFANCNPLGLTLKKTPSLASLLEVQLSPPQQSLVSSHDNSSARTRTDNLRSQPLTEKLKASNFPITSIIIGAWQRNSMNEGDMIGKLYYAKRKIVWEVLDGPLKSKIEIVWSNIIAIQAIMEDDRSGILKIELAKTPVFFRETKPQPRKHTNWQMGNNFDFSNGQASVCRIHCVTFPPKVLDRYYEKILQCDERLLKLSQQPFPSLQCSYFQSGMLGANFNGYGPAFAPLIQQYTNHPTMSRGPPPLSPVGGVPYRNHDGPSNYQLVAQRQHQPFWGHQGMNSPKENINNTAPLWPPMYVSQTSANQFVFNGNTNYQPNEPLMLEEIAKHVALLEDSQADESNLQSQMQPTDLLMGPNNINPNDNRRPSLMGT
ncbi:hypothetical protein OROMI_013274 [Orobanche minor]